MNAKELYTEGLLTELVKQINLLISDPRYHIYGVYDKKYVTIRKRAGGNNHVTLSFNETYKNTHRFLVGMNAGLQVTSIIK